MNHVNNKYLNTYHAFIISMSKNHFIHYVFILAFLWCNVVFTNETKADTTASSGGNQIIVSPINILLDLGESGYANVLILDRDGNPVEGRELQIIPQDRAKISISSDSLITSESGYINFAILGRQQGDTVITITDLPERHGQAGGVISANINVAIRNLIQNVLPYFYGDMQLSLINPTESLNYVKIQFHENGDRDIPPVTIRLEGKEMRNLKLSEEIGTTLKDGWVEVASTEIILGGTWTNKGYLYFNRIDE
jgi:hypothetical protein